MPSPIYTASSINNVPNYVEHAIKSIKGGELILIPKLSNDPQAIIATINPNSPKTKDVLEKLNNLLESLSNGSSNLQDYKNTLKNTYLPINEKLSFTPSIGHIQKSGDKLPPLGYLAEALLQAAIVARFVDKRDGSSNVNLKDVLKFLKQYVSQKSDSTAERAILDKLPNSKAINKAFEYSVPNKNKSIGNDKVYAYYSLNENAFNWLSKSMDSKVLTPFLNDAMRYVNNGAAKEHAHYFYTNNKVDRIDIVCTGIIGQNETKADIQTAYYEGWSGGRSGKQVDMTLNLSVKIRHTDQVGQISGIGSKTFGLLTEYFGVGFSQKELSDIDSIAATRRKESEGPDKDVQDKIYSLVYGRLAKANDITKLLQGMEYFIALTEAEARTLTVVDIGAGLKTYFVKNLKDVSKRLHNKKVTAKVKTGGGAGITKSIQYLVDGEVLFSISSRFTGKVYRNFITTGPLLRSFLSGEL